MPVRQLTHLFEFDWISKFNFWTRVKSQFIDQNISLKCCQGEILLHSFNLKINLSLHQNKIVQICLITLIVKSLLTSWALRVHSLLFFGIKNSLNLKLNGHPHNNMNLFKSFQRKELANIQTPINFYLKARWRTPKALIVYFKNTNGCSRITDETAKRSLS